MPMFIDQKFRDKVPEPKHGWRRRRVGEVVLAEDVVLVDDWGTCQPANDAIRGPGVGDKVLGSRDGFFDVVFTPYKRKPHRVNLIPPSDTDGPENAKTSEGGRNTGVIFPRKE